MDIGTFSIASTKGAGDHASRGHRFVYQQQVSRGKGAVRGVRITVALAELETAGR